MVLRGGPRGRVGRRRTCLKEGRSRYGRAALFCLSGYCGDRCWRLAWLGDAERRRDEEQVAAVVPVSAAASRRPLAARPERPGAREARGRLERAGPRAGPVDPARTA